MNDRATLAAEMATWITAWADRGRDGLPANEDDEARFDRLALALFARQFEDIPTYRRFCEAQGATPASVGSWREVPRVPVTAMKTAALSTEAAVAAPAACFETSGTTDGRPGRIWLEDTDTYDLSAAATFHAFCAADHFLRLRPGAAPVDAPAPVRCVSLVAADSGRPRSSLAHMVDHLFTLWDDGEGGTFLGSDGLDLPGLMACLHSAIAEERPTFLFATSTALALMLERWPKDARLVLPAGSRLLDTGGPKARHGTIDRAAQHRDIGALLGLEDDAIVGEFGMTELSSTRYETGVRGRAIGDVAPRRAYVGPPWLRTIVVDPATGEPVDDGDVGMLAHIDLASLDSVAFVLTGDLGRIVPVVGAGPAIELAGRVPGSEWRGCGLDVGELI